MKRIAVALLVALTAAAAVAQTKKELVAKVLQLTQPGMEQVARLVAERPVAQMMQRVGAGLARVPADKRQAVAKEIEADVRAYVEEATPLVRDRAIRLLPETLGAGLEAKFTEDELKAMIAWHESPINKKFQEFAPHAQRELMQKLATESRADLEPKLRALDARLSKRLGPPAAAASAPAAAASK